MNIYICGTFIVHFGQFTRLAVFMKLAVPCGKQC